jgi:hypothetical protein
MRPSARHCHERIAVPLDTHVRIAAWLHIVMGIIGAGFFVLLGLILGGFGAFGAAQADLQPGLVGWIAGLGVALFGFFIALCAGEIVGGVLLLRGSPSGRLITIIYSALSILNVPIGSVIGVYSLWALLREPARSLTQPGDAVQAGARPY